MHSIHKKFALLISGSVGAQILSFAVSPLVTRLYEPSVIGAFGTLSAILAILIPFISLSFPMVVILPRSNLRSLNVIKLNATLSFLLSFLLILAVWLICYLEQSLSDTSSLILIILSAALSVNIESLNFYLLKTGQYKLSAKSVFIQSVVSNLFKVLIGFYSNSIYIMLLSMLAGLLVCLIFIVYNINNPYKNIFSMRGLKVYKMLALNYIAYPVYRMPQGLIANLNQAIPVLSLGYLYNNEIVGYYSLARMIMFAPIGILSKAVSDIVYPDVNRIILSGGRVKRYLIRISTVLTLVSAIPTFVIMQYGREVFAFFFGSQWIFAGDFSSSMALWLFFSIINRPFVAAIPSLNLERFLFMNSIVNSVVCIFSVSISHAIFGDAFEVVRWYFLCSIIPQIMIVFFVLSKLDVK